MNLLDLLLISYAAFGVATACCILFLSGPYSLSDICLENQQKHPMIPSWLIALVVAFVCCVCAVYLVLAWPLHVNEAFDSPSR